MIIKRVKILTPFRGLPAEFEIKLNGNESGQKNREKSRNIEPLCLVGLNGSGKSNLLELIAEIFYYLEDYHRENSKNMLNHYATSFGFEIDYIITKAVFDLARVPWDEVSDYWEKSNYDPIINILKKPNKLPEISATFKEKKFDLVNVDGNRNSALLPSRVVGYSSGLNELLSNPFIKMDFQYFEDLKDKMGEKADLTIDVNRLYFLNYDLALKFRTPS